MYFAWRVEGNQTPSGIYGMSSYSGFLFKELFFICAIEEDAVIQELIYEALQKQSPHSKRPCMQINDFVVNYFLQHNYQSKYSNDRKANSEIMNILKDSQINRRIQFEINQKICQAYLNKIMLSIIICCYLPDC